MSPQKVTTRAKSRKKSAARKGNGKPKPGNGAGQPGAKPDPSASTRWFQMLNSLELRDLYTLADMVGRRIGNREAAGEDVVAKPATRETRMLDISDTLATLSHQLDVAASMETFEQAARRVVEAQRADGVVSWNYRLSRLERYAFPTLASLPVDKVKAAHINSLLEDAKSKGLLLSLSGSSGV
jgi:hypothetical protein